jgi:hypothetical protein
MPPRLSLTPAIAGRFVAVGRAPGRRWPLAHIQGRPSGATLFLRNAADNDAVGRMKVPSSAHTPFGGSYFAACVSLATKPNSREHATGMKQRLGSDARFPRTRSRVQDPGVRYDLDTAKPGRMVVAIGPVLPEGRALARGMTFAEAAGFLSRDEGEVRKKAKQLKIPYGRLRHYCHYRLRRGW